MTPVPERRLIVTWKNDASKKIVPVAELLVREDAPRFAFGYLAGVREAQREGFEPFLAFPSLEKRYESESLFPFFRNRVLPTTRPDYLETLAAIGLDPWQASVAELLGRTNGRRETDRIETVLVPIRDGEGRYQTHFLLRGVRHTVDAEKSIASLEPNQALELAIDGTNAYNARARWVCAGGRPLGHVPDYLVGDLDALDQLGAHPHVSVAQLNFPPHPAHFRLLCRLDADWPSGFRPFSDERLTPYIDRHAA